MQAIAVIEQAIRKQRTLVFDYKDEGLREVEPHLCGILGGKEQLHAYQIKGYSQSGGTPEWRNFTLQHIQNLNITERKFAVRNTYNPANANFSRVIMQVGQI